MVLMHLELFNLKQSNGCNIALNYNLSIYGINDIRTYTLGSVTCFELYRVFKKTSFKLMTFCCITIFYDVTPCNLLDRSQLSGGTCCLFFPEDIASSSFEVLLQPMKQCIAMSQKMEILRFTRGRASEYQYRLTWPPYIQKFFVS